MRTLIKIAVTIFLLYAILMLLYCGLFSLLTSSPYYISTLVQYTLIPYSVSIVAMGYCIFHIWSNHDYFLLLSKKRYIVNSVAAIVFVTQSLSLFLNVFNERNADDCLAVLWNNFGLSSYICSVLVIIIFILFYNFDFKFLKNKILDSLIILVVTFGGYIHIWQIAVQRDFILTSCLLVLLDIYIVSKIIQNFARKTDKAIPTDETINN